MTLRCTLICLSVTVCLMSTYAALAPSLSSIVIEPENICGDSMSPRRRSSVLSTSTNFPASFRRMVSRLQRKTMSLQRSVAELLDLYETERMSRIVHIEDSQYFPPCFNIIRATQHDQLNSPSQVYMSLNNDWEEMKTILGTLVLVIQDENSSENSEFTHYFQRIKTKTKHLLCELSFTISGMEGSDPATVVVPRLLNWCEADDSCSRYSRDSMILSMISDLSSVLIGKYRDIRMNL